MLTMRCSGNAKWPFALSHNRLQTGGWARQQNMKVMPLAQGTRLSTFAQSLYQGADLVTEMAGVNMRLEAGAVRSVTMHYMLIV